MIPTPQSIKNSRLMNFLLFFMMLNLETIGILFSIWHDATRILTNLSNLSTFVLNVISMTTANAQDAMLQNLIYTKIMVLKDNLCVRYARINFLLMITATLS